VYVAVVITLSSSVEWLRWIGPPMETPVLGAV
jgi:hypothetical protein